MENKDSIVESLDIELIRNIFYFAYLAGRDDGSNGIFIEYNYAFENFLDTTYGIFAKNSE